MGKKTTDVTIITPASMPENANPTQNTNNVDIKTTTTTTKLTEKQLRKLEWEKKLAQEKNANKDNSELSKADLKAKRREQQEAQRQAKTASVKVKPTKEEPTKQNVPPVAAKVTPETVTINKSPKSNIKRKPITTTHKLDNKVQLVKHLYRNATLDSAKYNEIHPAFVRLGSQYASHTIIGSNARTLALLAALKYLVHDIQVPSKHEFTRYLESNLQISTEYLHHCRPLAVAMVNTLRLFKIKVTQMCEYENDNDKRSKLLEVIDSYITDDIRKAGDAISIAVNEKICSGDILLTYGCSSLIKKILCDAHKDGKHFEVIVVDSRPLLEGREMLRRLVVAGIKCTYILINAISYVMPKVTKILLGAHALLNNGYVMSRIGTAQVALIANAYNKPVLVCCEKYKFSERVQTDAFVYNEIGDSQLLLSVADEKSCLSSCKNNPKLQLLNLLYDITPPNLVTAVVTEISIIPCTSIPVVLRINANECT